MLLSEHFSLAELCKSDNAVRLGIDNIPTDETIIANLGNLCENILEPVRKQFGPFKPNSGYRCPELNAATPGSSKTSQHCKGQAADIEVPGVSNWALFHWIRENLSFDQLIAEYMIPGDASAGWVHASWSNEKDNRKQVLVIDKMGKRPFA